MHVAFPGPPALPNFCLGQRRARQKEPWDEVGSPAFACLLGSLAVAAPCWSIKFYVSHLRSSSPNHCQSWGPLPAPVCQLSISTAPRPLPQTANMDSSPCLNFSRVLDPFCYQDRLRYLLYGPQRAQMTVHLLPRRPSLGPEQPKWD